MNLRLSSVTMATKEDVCLVNYSIFADINIKPNHLPDFFPEDLELQWTFILPHHSLNIKPGRKKLFLF